MVPWFNKQNAERERWQISRPRDMSDRIRLSEESQKVHKKEEYVASLMDFLGFVLFSS